MNEKAYYESVNTKNELKLRELQKELPPFCREFFIGMRRLFRPGPYWLMHMI